MHNIVGPFADASTVCADLRLVLSDRRVGTLLSDVVEPLLMQWLAKGAGPESEYNLWKAPSRRQRSDSRAQAAWRAACARAEVIKLDARVGTLLHAGHSRRLEDVRDGEFGLSQAGGEGAGGGRVWK